MITFVRLNNKMYVFHVIVIRSCSFMSVACSHVNEYNSDTHKHTRTHKGWWGVCGGGRERVLLRVCGGGCVLGGRVPFSCP